MKLVSLFATLALLLAFALPSAAFQTQAAAPLTGEQIRQRFDEMKKRLELTPEQEEQVRPVLLEELDKARALRDKYSDRDKTILVQLQMAREFRGIQNDAYKRMEKILTKKQLQEYKKIQDENRQMIRERARN